ncbi:DUF4416 family protein [Candidatus Bipolaricaulota bacterium]|nr:DUF4416 family protein [Candidatus Bipolaricaulota bacterium]
MGKPTEPKPVKLFTGLLTGRPEILPAVEDDLRAEFGSTDLESGLIPFDFTDYYREEMGKDIKRKFLSFEELIGPGEISEIKLITNKMEEKFSENLDVDLPRPINIDPGYVALSKMALASTKNYSHRLYVGGGIYGEVALQYKDGCFHPLPWTYPDYRSEEYLEFFERVRTRYCEQLD